MAGMKRKYKNGKATSTAKKSRVQTRTYTYRRSSAVPVETKYFDTSFSQTISSAADWTGSEVPCTNYIQSDGTTVGAYTDSALIPSAVGAGYGQVQGSKYFIKQLRARGSVHSGLGSDQADVPVPADIRLSLVLDTQPNGTQAQGEDVYTDMGTAAQNTHSFLAMGAGSGGRFKVLWDKVITLNPAVAGTDGASTVSISRNGSHWKATHKFKKPLQICLKANSSTPTVASLSNNNIFLLAHASTAAPAASIFGCSRCYYID